MYYILLTSCLTTIDNHVINYCESANERNGKNLFWHASSVSTYDFSTLYTTMPHNLNKEELTELIEQT